MQVTPESEWTAFIQTVADRWMSYTDALGNPLDVRPHWAKQWQSLELRGRPSVEYLRDVAYPARITEFRAGLDTIAAQGGYGLSDLRLFSNPLLDQLFARVFR